MLKAAASLQLLDVTSTGAYTLGIHGAALAGNPWIAKFITHHHLLYEDLTDPIALLKGEVSETKLKGYWGYAGSNSKDAVGEANAAAYTALMAASQEAVAAEILAAYDFGQHTPSDRRRRQQRHLPRGRRGPLSTAEDDTLRPARRGRPRTRETGGCRAGQPVDIAGGIVSSPTNFRRGRTSPHSSASRMTMTTIRCCA